MKLNNGCEKKKTTPKAVSLLKEDRQAFGFIVAKSVSLEEAFQYPITTVPLAVATSESTLRQTNKASLRNYLMNKSGSISEDTPKYCSWFIDGLAAIRSLRPKKTYREWLKSLLQFITPPKEAEATQVVLVNDTYKEDSIKGGRRKERGESGPRVRIEGFDQHMLQGSKRQDFLNSGENKEELVRLVVKYLETREGISLLQHPHIVTAGDTTYSIKDGQISMLYKCNQEEADTRLVLHASLEDNDVVVVSKDTDVLILLIWAYEKCNIQKKWYLKYDHNKYADINTICTFLGPKICLALPAVHAMTGCDTTSYLFKVGKVKVMKKLLNTPCNADLLMDLGKDQSITEEMVQSAKEFLRAILYTGKQKETYIQTRIRLYKEMEVKSSMCLPPDPDSVVQVIKRVHYQVYFWRRCTEINNEIIPFSNYGWIWYEKQKLVVPVWFTGSQLPTSLSNKRRKKTINEKKADDEDADAEDELEPQRGTHKKRRVRNQMTSRKRDETSNRNLNYQADDEMDVNQEAAADPSLIEEDTSFADSNGKESDWEVSDFLSRGDSEDEWMS